MKSIVSTDRPSLQAFGAAPPFGLGDPQLDADQDAGDGFPGLGLQGGAFAAIPNLRHLQVLQLVARHGSISQAASEANLSQPAVTQAIARLEQALGHPLFERSNHGTLLTKAGELYLDRLQRFFELCEAAIEEVCSHLPRRGRMHYVTSAHLRSLRALSIEPSTGRAAALIGVSVSTLKRALRDLETVLGMTLRDQGRYGIVLNKSGQQLAQKISAALNELAAAQSDLDGLKGQASGRIAIGTLPLSGAYIIGEAIAELLQHHPAARVTVTNAPYNMLLSALKTSEIDMIFGLVHDRDEDIEVTPEPMFSDPYCLMASAEHPLAQKAHVGIDELLDYEWIAPAYGSPRREKFDLIFAEATRRPKVHVEMSNLAAIMAILGRSQLMSFVSRLEIQRELDLGFVVAIPVPVALPPMAKGMTYRGAWKPTPIQSRFLDILRSQVNRAELARRKDEAAFALLPLRWPGPEAGASAV